MIRQHDLCHIILTNAGQSFDKIIIGSNRREIERDCSKINLSIFHLDSPQENAVSQLNREKADIYLLSSGAGTRKRIFRVNFFPTTEMIMTMHSSNLYRNNTGGDGGGNASGGIGGGGGDSTSSSPSAINIQTLPPQHHQLPSAAASSYYSMTSGNGNGSNNNYFMQNPSSNTTLSSSAQQMYQNLYPSFSITNPSAAAAAAAMSSMTQPGFYSTNGSTRNCSSLDGYPYHGNVVGGSSYGRTAFHGNSVVGQNSGAGGGSFYSTSPNA